MALPLRATASVATVLAAILPLGGPVLVPVLVPAAAAEMVRGVVLFVPDGLRAGMVTPEHAPAMAALKREGVEFANSHSLFPTFTMPNASAMATGHGLGDTGTFSNTIYAGYPVAVAGGTLTPFLENDPVLGDVDEHFAGDYLDEETLLRAARAKGFNTAAVGKLGPALVFDHTERTGGLTVTVDDQTGTKNGIPLGPWVTDGLGRAGLPAAAPTRGANGQPGNATTPGTRVANIEQQRYFADVLTRVVLPKFRDDGRPFLIVYWSRDPDGTQHNQGDSHLQLTPGINGPTSVAAIRNADDNFAAIRRTLDELGLAATTDVVVSADHGFSTISKQSATSPAARAHYADVPEGLLPPGFVALDLARALGLPLHDPDSGNAPVGAGAHPRLANGLIGADPTRPDVIVAANGGSDLVYVPDGDRERARRVVEALLAQDYVSGLFVDDALGLPPGTLPLSAIGLRGGALTPKPAIVVNFRSQATGCDDPRLCTAEVADSVLQQGQGMHGSFSRADTHNFMAAAGPSFRRGFVDEAPASNADVGMTLARLLDLHPASRGSLVGRPLTEALDGATAAGPTVRAATLRSEAGAGGLVTVVETQVIEASEGASTTTYFDAAGFAGRTVGLQPEGWASSGSATAGTAHR